jgi:hypothetical protein
VAPAYLGPDFQTDETPCCQSLAAGRDPNLKWQRL